MSVNRPEVTITRILDATPGRVFKAWTDPKQVMQWWGPHCFTVPLCEQDVRPGGAMLMHMQGPDGTIHKMTGEYQEVVEPHKLVVISRVVDNEGKPLFEILNTVTFEDFEGKTKLTLIARVLMAVPGTEPALDGMHEGWSQTLDRLGAFLANS